MKLSTHFSEAEFCKSSTALRLGIDNSLPDELRANATALAVNIFEPIRKKFGAHTPNSAYRCPALNKALGSSPNSQHTFAEAGDCEVIGVDNLTLARWVRDTLTFDQLILEFYTVGDMNSGWVHISYKKSGTNRGEVLTITSKHEVLIGLEH